jgi:hypothetical protein
VAGGAVVLLIGAAAGVPVRDLLKDPAVLPTVAWYSGLLSHAGVVLWAAAATVAAFGFGVAGRGVPGTGLLLGVAVLSALLMADDLLLLHEDVIRGWGIPEVVTIAAYGAFGAAVLARNAARVISGPGFGTLVLAMALFAVSLFFDNLPKLGVVETVGQEIVEDLAKLGGIVLWLEYVVGITRHAVVRREG